MFGPMNFRFGRRWVQDVLAEASTSIDISGSKLADLPFARPRAILLVVAYICLQGVDSFGRSSESIFTRNSDCSKMVLYVLSCLCLWGTLSHLILFTRSAAGRDWLVTS